MSDSLSPITGPIDLRKDTLTGVIFNATDPAQLAAHPSNTSVLTRRSVAGKYDNVMKKEASAIAGVVVRDVNNPSKR